MNINDVAKEAGVSRGSVSNYLNHRSVSDKMRVKIQRAISDLNYVPNTAAQDLRSKGSRFVVFIIPTVWEPYLSELTYYVQSYLTDHGFKMILCVSDSEFDKEREFIDLAEGQKAAGIISISYSQMNEHVKPTMPLVSIEKEPTGRFPLVSSDNYQGGKLAAETLNNLGSKKLIYVGAKEMPSDAMVARLSGFADYCSGNGLQFDKYQLSSFRKRSEVDKELSVILADLKKRDQLTQAGIFASSDDYALIIYKMLLQMKVRVPEDVQLIGFNGSRTSMSDEPVLSSIRQPVEKIAETAVLELEKKIAENKDDGEPTAPSRIFLPVSFQKGETTV